MLVMLEHFLLEGKKSDNPLSLDFIPSIFNYMPSPEKRKRKKMLEMFNRRQKLKLQKVPTGCPHDGSKHPVADQIPTREPPITETTDREPENDVQSVPDDPATPPCIGETTEKRMQSLEAECQALRSENILLKEKLNKTALNETSLQNNDKKVNFLTGLPTYTVLMTIFHIIRPCLKPKSSLTCFQQFMLALMKLRINLSFEFLAFYFAIDATTDTTNTVLFKNRISAMYCKLVPSLVLWPDRESLRTSLPYVFRNGSFQKTACIIDCFEIFLEKPSPHKARGQCWSSYKSHHTMKYLIAICPQEHGNFLSHLLPADVVLADRGFLIRESVQSCQAELKMPAFTRRKKQLDPVDLESTRGLASLRIHIERVIGVLRQKYTVLQSTVPIIFTDIDRENDVTYLDKIVSVCCALTNVSESVVPFE
uniref:DDE Tnp4 domain-containing protein n=1 Tax=Myripristis murdjan TaxID=586833 RepID=A0A667X785_9TELE